MLSCLSRVQLFATLWTVTHQVPLSLGFSGQEYWSGLPCPSSRGSSPPQNRIRISCNGRWVLYLERHLGSPHVYTHIPSSLESLPLYVPAEHWVELPVLCSRFSLVIYLSTASVVCSQAFPEPTIGWKCRPPGWKDATPAVYPSGRMCACRVPQRADVRPRSCITWHRARLSAEDEMAVAAVQAQASSWLHPAFPMLSLLSSTSLPRSEHTHSCLLRPAATSPLPRLWSPLPQEGVCSRPLCQLSRPWSCCRLRFVPAVCHPLSASPSYDCSIAKCFFSLECIKLLVSEPLQNWRSQRIFYLWKLYLWSSNLLEMKTWIFKKYLLVYLIIAQFMLM